MDTSLIRGHFLLAQYSVWNRGVPLLVAIYMYSASKGGHVQLISESLTILHL